MSLTINKTYLAIGLLLFVFGCKVQKSEVQNSDSMEEGFKMVTIPYHMIDSCFPDFSLEDSTMLAFDSISIYNRWGEKMFHSTQLDEIWLCATDSNDIPEGTYFYVLYFRKDIISNEISGNKNHFSGTVTYIKKES